MEINLLLIRKLANGKNRRNKMLKFKEYLKEQRNKNNKDKK